MSDVLILKILTILFPRSVHLMMGFGSDVGAEDFLNLK